LSYSFWAKTVSACVLTREMVLAIDRYTTIRESVTQLLGGGGFNILDCNEAAQGSGQNINLDESPVPEEENLSEDQHHEYYLTIAALSSRIFIYV